MLGIRQNSVTYKTTVLYVVLATLLISVFNFIVWENQSDLITRNQQLTSEVQSVRLKNLVSRFLGDSTRVPNSNDFLSLSKASKLEKVSQPAIFTEAGVKVWPQDGGTAENREVIIINRAVAKYGLENKEFYHDLDIQSSVIHLYIPITQHGKSEMLVVRYELPMQRLTEDRNSLLRLCILVGCIVILIQFVFGLILHRIVITPIVKMEALAHAVSKGDFNLTFEIKQQDEIGRLAMAYNEMIRNLSRMQDEAKNSNPLTGLPGNNVIIKTINELIAMDTEFAVIYGDLDNFKAYNDKYGFSKGDDAILYTRDCFQEVAKRQNDPNIFIGHEGGDDFVLITPFAIWENVCKGILSKFDEGITQFYNESDSKQGYIDSIDRRGQRLRFPLISISLAVVSNHFKPVTDFRQLISAAAEMKKFVKKTEGSTYAIDKRRD